MSKISICKVTYFTDMHLRFGLVTYQVLCLPLIFQCLVFECHTERRPTVPGGTESTLTGWTGGRESPDRHEVWTWTPVMHSAFWLESTNLILTVGQSLMTILLYMFCCCNTMAYNREWSEITEIRRVTLKEYWKDVEIHILYIKDRCSYTDIRLRPYPYLVYQARVVTCACPKVYPTLLLFLTVMCIVILKNDNLLTWY